MDLVVVVEQVQAQVEQVQQQIWNRIISYKRAGGGGGGAFLTRW
jgi:hypothetical protein